MFSISCKGGFETAHAVPWNAHVGLSGTRSLDCSLLKQGECNVKCNHVGLIKIGREVNFMYMAHVAALVLVHAPVVNGLACCK